MNGALRDNPSNHPPRPIYWINLAWRKRESWHSILCSAWGCVCLCVCCPCSDYNLSQRYSFSWSPAPARSLLKRSHNLSPYWLIFLLCYLIYLRCDLSAGVILTHAFKVFAATNINSTKLICYIFTFLIFHGITEKSISLLAVTLYGNCCS